MARMHRRGLLGAAAALGLASRGGAQEGWRPSGTMRVIVPAAPGGTTDIMGRLLAAQLGQSWGVSAVVENRSGGGGTIGTLEVVRARPDGHTLLLGNIGPQSIGYSLFHNLQYGPGDLLPVSNMIRGPNVLVVHPSLPVNTVPELVAHLRREAGRLAYGTPGVGQSPHLSAVWFHQLTETRGNAIHYRGAAPAMVALVGGEIQFMFDNLTTAVEQVRAGKVRALAVTSADRNPQLPDLPSLRETMPELANYDVSTWFGAFYGAGVPAAAVRAVNAEIKTLLDQPAMQGRFAGMGGIADYGTPEEYARFVRAETEKWRAVIQKEGLQIDVG